MQIQWTDLRQAHQKLICTMRNDSLSIYDGILFSLKREGNAAIAIPWMNQEHTMLRELGQTLHDLAYTWTLKHWSS